MMHQPIVTSALLMDLADVARAEDLTPFDPWRNPPLCPYGAHHVVTLGLDGAIRTVPAGEVEWRDVAGYRFEDSFGKRMGPEAYVPAYRSPRVTPKKRRPKRGKRGRG